MGKYALIIANTEYSDPGLAQLTTPGKDAEDFARVLSNQDIGAFDDVKLLLNQLSFSVQEAIEEFFDQKKPDDLLVVYFAGHAIRDESGRLCLAVNNTNRFRLRATAIRSDFVRKAMDQSRSKRQVLILDCVNSSAFAQGAKAESGGSVGTGSAFEGTSYGRVVLAASDSIQFAWEGDKVIGNADNSLFTHFLVQGLEGEADLDGDGRITVDELYDYAYEKVKLAIPKQTPAKFSSKQQGEIVLRQITRIEDIKPVALPEGLIEAIEDSRAFVRKEAVGQLERLLTGKNLGLARSAREALERLEQEDDSRTVSQAASQALRRVEYKEALDALESAEVLHNNGMWGELKASKKRATSFAQARSETKKNRNFETSVAYPKLLSKKFASLFVLQYYLPEQRPQAARNVRAAFQNPKIQVNEFRQASSLKPMQTVRVKFFSAALEFSEPVTKTLDQGVNKFMFLGTPKDQCEPGPHEVLISITDGAGGKELESLTVTAQVVDFAFDHISRPLLSRISATVLGIGAFVMFLLGLLEQIDKTVGVTSGTAAGVLAVLVYGNFYNLYQRIRPNTP